LTTGNEPLRNEGQSLFTMKKILIIIFLSPFLSAAQQRQTSAMKKANRIIIVTNRPAKQNYQFIQSALEKDGYTIHLKSDDSLTVQTAETRSQSGSVTYYITGLAKENEIILSGKYFSKVESSIGGTSPKLFVFDISNTGNKGTASREMFETLEELAKIFNAPRYYMIQETKKTSVF
jgi:diphthamide synthase subunit DPH2